MPGKPVVEIRTGPIADRAFRGMRHAIAALARQGNNLIVDEVMEACDWAEYVELLSGVDTYLVGVLCSLDVLEARERERGDRMIGLARRQYDRIHAGIAYDLTVDTSRATAVACAERIKEAFAL